MSSHAAAACRSARTAATRPSNAAVIAAVAVVRRRGHAAGRSRRRRGSPSNPATSARCADSVALVSSRTAARAASSAATRLSICPTARACAANEPATLALSRRPNVGHSAWVELDGNRKIGLKLAQLYLPHRGRDGSGARFDPTMWLTPLRDAKFWRMPSIRGGPVQCMATGISGLDQCVQLIAILRRGWWILQASLGPRRPRGSRAISPPRSARLAPTLRSPTQSETSNKNLRSDDEWGSPSVAPVAGTARIAARRRHG